MWSGISFWFEFAFLSLLMRLNTFLYVCIYIFSLFFISFISEIGPFISEIANTFGSVGNHAMMALWPQSNHSQHVNECDSVQIKLYLQKQGVGWIWPVAYSLLWLREFLNLSSFCIFKYEHFLKCVANIFPSLCLLTLFVVGVNL